MTVAFVHFEIMSGQIPVTMTPNYTPGGAGNQLVMLVQDTSSTSATFAGSGSASSFVQTAVSSILNFNDGVGSTYGLFNCLSCAAGAQTFTLSAPSGDYTGPCYFTEFSGALRIANPLYTVTASPGAGAGAIVGQAVTVASTDVLVAIVFDATNQYATAATVSSPGSSSAITSYSASTGVYWTGTGGSMQPTFTANATATTDTYILIQWVMSATGGGGSGTASVAWLT